MRLLLLGLALSLAPRAARADHDDATFATLDRADGVSRAGIETSFVFLDDYGDGVARSAQRYDAHAQSVNPQTGLGAYASIPVTVARIQGRSAEGALGNIELGALYAHAPQPGLDLIAHAGLVLPSSADPDDAAVYSGGVPNDLAPPSRLTDTLLGRPRPVALRFASALRYRREQLVARLDVGIDQTVAQLDSFKSKTGVRVAGGAGWDFGAVMPAIELATLFNDPRTNKPSYAAALSARARVARIQPFAALIVPIDGLNFNAALTLGVDVLLP